MKNRLLTLLVLLSTTGFGQDLSVCEKYRADFDFLVEKLIETHPDPYSGFGGPTEFSKEKLKAAQLISDSMTDEDFVLLTNRFLSNLDDGHTTMFFPRKESGIKKFFPLELKMSSDKIFVQNSTEEYKALKGGQLLEVNKVPISKLLAKTTTLEPSENIAGEYYGLVKIIRNPALSHQFFGTERIECTVSRCSGETSLIEIPYQDKVDLLPENSIFDLKNDNHLLYWAMVGRNKNIGYLAWNSVLSREVVEDVYKNNPERIRDNLNWAYSYISEKQSGNIEQDILRIPSIYEQFNLLAKAMNANKSKYLIIDLRSNGGGMTPLIRPLLYVLFGNRYLEFDFEAEYIRKISPLYIQKLGFNGIEDFNNSYNSNFRIGDYISDNFGNLDPNLSLEQKRISVENGYNGFGAEYIKTTELLTDVSIYVLTSPKTFSAAYHFSYFLKKLGRTKIVGVASRQAGNSFMETTNITLPNTRITGSISNSKQILFKNDSILGRILTPDYEMSWSDFRHFDFDKNAEILKAVEIIENEIK